MCIGPYWEKDSGQSSFLSLLHVLPLLFGIAYFTDFFSSISKDAFETIISCASNVHVMQNTTQLGLRGVIRKINGQVLRGLLLAFS